MHNTTVTDITITLCCDTDIGLYTHPNSIAVITVLQDLSSC